jgi:hypothetical protein
MEEKNSTVLSFLRGFSFDVLLRSAELRQAPPSHLSGQEHRHPRPATTPGNPDRQLDDVGIGPHPEKIRLALKGHFSESWVGIGSLLGGAAMERDLVRDGLRFKLAEQYRECPTRFLSLSKEAIDSALGREIVAELRNEGHIEEEVRGKVRLTPRGYRAFQSDPSPYSYRNFMTPRVVSASTSPVQ